MCVFDKLSAVGVHLRGGIEAFRQLHGKAELLHITLSHRLRQVVHLQARQLILNG